MFGIGETKEEGKKESKDLKTKGKSLSGVVISNKMTDTCVVEVSQFSKHPKYHKFIKSRKRFKVHDEGNTAEVGQKVNIRETKPISKTKKFIIEK